MLIEGCGEMLDGFTKLDIPEADIFTKDNFLTNDQCGYLISHMRNGRLRKSTISNPEQEPDQYFRTSKTCDFDYSDPVINLINQKIHFTLNVETRMAETTQGQYYDVGEEFKPHFDFFFKDRHEQYFTPLWGQRKWTLMVYLNDVAEGGDTVFTKLNLRIAPKRGRALVWDNLRDGVENKFTMHHGTPPTKGFKAIITKWTRLPGVDYAERLL